MLGAHACVGSRYVVLEVVQRAEGAALCCARACFLLIVLAIRLQLDDDVCS